jgi:hypothetical protein
MHGESKRGVATTLEEYFVLGSSVRQLSSSELFDACGTHSGGLHSVIDLFKRTHTAQRGGNRIISVIKIVTRIVV